MLKSTKNLQFWPLHDEITLQYRLDFAIQQHGNGFVLFIPLLSSLETEKKKKKKLVFHYFSVLYAKDIIYTFSIDKFL